MAKVTRAIVSVILAGALSAAMSGEESPAREDGTKRVNGVEHYYVALGSGEPFIVLHGGPGMYHDELVPFFTDFAKNHRVIFYDQRGNGRSPMGHIDENNFSQDVLVEDLEGLRRALGLGKMNIIGHSWGGLLGMSYAAKYPENVKRLIAVSAAPVNTELLIRCYENQVSRFTEEEWAHLQALWESDAYRAGDPAVHNEAMRLSEGATFYDKSFVDSYMRAAAFTEKTATNAVALEGPSRAMKLNITVQPELSKIACPTLLVQGMEDFIVKEAPELAHELIEGSELAWIEQCGHYPFIEKRDEFFEVINAFVERTK